MQPWDRAPIEIWQTIFLALVQTESIPEFAEVECSFWGRKPQTLSSTQLPLILPRTPSLLTQVCHQWRKYAYGTPGLWNVLFVETPRYTSEYNASQYAGICKLVKRRLTLSRFMPMAIGFDAKDDTAFASLIIPALLPFSRQWETVHIYALPLSFTYLDSLHAGDTPGLASLKTVSHIYVPGRMDPSAVTCVPSIDRVSSITQLCTSFLPSPGSPVYEKLEELHIQHLRSETRSMLLGLASCPCLKVLTLSGFGLSESIVGSAAPSPSPLNIPTLEVLNLKHPVGESLLDLLVLPNLKSLFLCGKCNRQSTQSMFESINRLQERSGVNSLERLSISLQMHGLNPSMLIDFLRVNSSLTFLWIDDTYKFMNQPLVTSCLLDALTEPKCTNNANSLLCPQLKTLRLTGCSQFEDDKLLTFMKSRYSLDCSKRGVGSKRGICQTITRMDISIKRKVEAEVLETIHKWQQLGFPISLDSRS